MHLQFVLAVVATLIISEFAPAEPVAHGAARLGLSLAGIFLVALFAVGCTTRTVLRLRCDSQQTRRWLQEFDRLRTVHSILWLAMTVAILYGVGWARLVCFNWGLHGFILIDDLVLLVPAMLPLALSWAAFYGVEHALTAHAGAKADMRARARYVTVCARHYFGIVLIPVLTLRTAEDILSRFAPSWLEGQGGWIPMGLIMLAVLLGFPVLVRRIWTTRSLVAGPLRRRLDDASRRWVVAVRDILIWNTDDRMVNAAVTGLLPAVRYVFLSDGLMRRFSDDEIEAIYAHEVGHIRHKHLVLRTIAVLAPVTFVFACHSVLSGSPIGVAGHAAVTMSFAMPVAMLVSTGMAGAGILGLGHFARLMEHEADLFACRQLDHDRTKQDFESPSGPTAAPGSDLFQVTLEKIGRYGGSSPRTSSWLHPSIDQRIAFVESASRSPEHQHRFERKMRYYKATFILAFCVSLLALV